MHNFQGSKEYPNTTTPRVLSLFFLASFGPVICTVLSGCANTPAKDRDAWDVNSAWKWHNLYTAAAPHAALYVEVDFVEDMEPADKTLIALKEFLETYCDKPGGVIIAQSSRIPRNIAHGYYRQELALKFMDGPPASANDPDPAYMYILFYDSTLEPRPKPIFMTRTAAAMPASRNWPAYSGHAEFLPYPGAIYIHGRTRGGDIDRPLLLHEVAHLLGPRPGERYHCDSDRCFLYPSLGLRIRSYALFRNYVYNTNLCDRCRTGLLQAKTNEAPNNLRFRGPWMMRQETNYAVLSVPMVALIVPDPLPENEFAKLLDWIKDTGLQTRLGVNKTNREHALITGTVSNNNTPASKKRTALESASDDWYAAVRERARQEISKQ